MKIHEYQAKEVLRKYGVKVLNGVLVEKAEDAGAAYDKLGGKIAVVKAQIHAGGRGKGGGVKLAKSRDEATALAKQMLGMNLITHQTGPKGKTVNKVYIEQGCDIRKELYLAVALDRAQSCAVLMACAEGGVEIETIAAERPEAIFKERVDPLAGLQSFQARRMAVKLGIPPELINKAAGFMVKLCKVFTDMDCEIAEINPLVLTPDDVIALDAKINFDDNALYRHPELEGYRDFSEETSAETEAKKFELSYIKLDGNIGCMVNGAGLAMATMDIIKLHGGEPANFLDVGGGATAEKVEAGFKLILSDPNVKGVLVNIFGGIMRCDVIAEGVIAAVKSIGLKVPLVVRLEGNKVEEGRKMLGAAFSNLIPADGMTDAAKKIVAAVKAK